MTTIQLYHKHKAGDISREKFLYEVRKDSNLPWVTNVTSYDDAVKILKNKGIISELEKPTKIYQDDQWEIDFMSDLKANMVDPNQAEEIVAKAKESMKDHGETLKGMYKMFASPAASTAFLSDFAPEQIKKSTNEAKGSINDPGLMAMRAKKDAAKNEKEAPKSDKNKAKIDALIKQKKEIEREMENDPEVEKEGGKKADEYGDKLDKIDAKIKKLRQLNESDVNIATDPAVDRVNPYFLKRGVMKLLANEKELTNDSYINALNKAAKQLEKNPHAFDEEMLANAKEVEKADTKLKTQEVKKNNHVDKANEMKKVKVKSLKESTIDQLIGYLKKKELVNEDVHWNYTVGSEVHTPNGPGKVVEIVGGTLTVEMEDGTQQDVQINTVDHFTQKAQEEPPAQEPEQSVADMWANWKGKPFSGMVGDPDQFNRPLDLDKIRQYMEVYGHDKEKMSKLKKALEERLDVVKGKNASTGEEEVLATVAGGQGSKAAQNLKSKGATSVTVKSIA